MDTKRPFEQIVDSYGDTVLRVCRSLVGPDDADDAWSETFISAMRAYSDLPADANHEAWLVRIAHNRAIDHLRSRRRRAVPRAELPERQHSTLGIPGGNDSELWPALAKLPTKQRQTVAYHYLTGLTYAEIADIVGGSADAARRAATDGIKALRVSYPHAISEGSTP